MLSYSTTCHHRSSWLHSPWASALARSCPRDSFGGKTPPGRGPPRPQQCMPSGHVQIREHRRPCAATDADVVAFFVRPCGSLPPLPYCTAAPQVHRLPPGPASTRAKLRASSSPAWGILRLSQRLAAPGTGSHPLGSQRLLQQREPSASAARSGGPSSAPPPSHSSACADARAHKQGGAPLPSGGTVRLCSQFRRAGQPSCLHQTHAGSRQVSTESYGSMPLVSSSTSTTWPL